MFVSLKSNVDIGGLYAICFILYAPIGPENRWKLRTCTMPTVYSFGGMKDPDIGLGVLVNARVLAKRPLI